MDIRPFSRHAAELRADGFEENAVPSQECWEDAEIVAREPCPDCGGPVTFVPFRKWDTTTKRHLYHAYGVCRRCDAGYAF